MVLPRIYHCPSGMVIRRELIRVSILTMNTTPRSIEEILEDIYFSIESHTTLNGLKAEDSDGIENVLSDVRGHITTLLTSKENEMIERLEKQRRNETGCCDCEDCSLRCSDIPETINETIEDAQTIIKDVMKG